MRTLYINAAEGTGSQPLWERATVTLSDLFVEWRDTWPNARFERQEFDGDVYWWMRLDTVCHVMAMEKTE